MASQKAKEIQSDDRSDLETLNEQLKETCSRVVKGEYAIYKAVSMLPLYLKEL